MKKMQKLSRKWLSLLTVIGIITSVLLPTFGAMNASADSDWITTETGYGWNGLRTVSASDGYLYNVNPTQLTTWGSKLAITDLPTGGISMGFSAAGVYSNNINEGLNYHYTFDGLTLDFSNLSATMALTFMNDAYTLTTGLRIDRSVLRFVIDPINGNFYLATLDSANSCWKSYAALATGNSLIKSFTSNTFRVKFVKTGTGYTITLYSGTQKLAMSVTSSQLTGAAGAVAVNSPVRVFISNYYETPTKYTSSTASYAMNVNFLGVMGTSTDDTVLTAYKAMPKVADFSTADVYDAQAAYNLYSALNATRAASLSRALQSSGISNDFSALQARASLAIPDIIQCIDNLGSITLDSSATLRTIKTHYDNFSSSDKALVTNYASFTAAMSSYSSIAAAADSFLNIATGANRLILNNSSTGSTTISGWSSYMTVTDLAASSGYGLHFNYTAIGAVDVREGIKVPFVLDGMNVQLDNYVPGTAPSMAIIISNDNQWLNRGTTAGFGMKLDTSTGTLSVLANGTAIISNSSLLTAANLKYKRFSIQFAQRSDNNYDVTVTVGTTDSVTGVMNASDVTLADKTCCYVGVSGATTGSFSVDLLGVKAQISNTTGLSTAVANGTATITVNAPTGKQLSASGIVAQYIDDNGVTKYIVPTRNGFRSDAAIYTFSFTYPTDVKAGEVIHVNSSFVDTGVANFGCFGVGVKSADADSGAGVRFGYRFYKENYTIVRMGTYLAKTTKTPAQLAVSYTSDQLKTILTTNGKLVPASKYYDDCNNYMDFTQVITNPQTGYTYMSYSYVTYKDAGGIEHTVFGDIVTYQY